MLNTGQPAVSAYPEIGIAAVHQDANVVGGEPVSFRQHPPFAVLQSVEAIASSEPDHSVRILMNGSDGRRSQLGVHRFKPPVAQTPETFSGADPQHAVAILKDGIHAVGSEAIGRRIGSELALAEPAQAGPGSDPHRSVPAAADRIDITIRQSLFFGKNANHPGGTEPI